MAWVFSPGRLEHFPMEEIVFLFTWIADAANRAPDERGNAQGYQNCRKIITQPENQVQHFVHLCEQHKYSPIPKNAET
jgi:hypothetical protein